MASTKQTLTLAVGSTNPVKAKAAKAGIAKVFTEDKYDIQVHTFSVPSGVSDQPMGDFETKKGSKNRAKGAADKFKEEFGVFPSLAVGLEGGCELMPADEITEKEQLCTIAYMCVFDAEKDKTGFGRTGSYVLPDKILWFT